MPQIGETNTKFGFFKSLCCGKQIAVPKGNAFPGCPNHPGLTTWVPIEDDNIVQLVQIRKSERPGPRFNVGDKVTCIAGLHKGMEGVVMQVMEGALDLVHRYHVQVNGGPLIRCFGFELEGFEDQLSRSA